MKVTLFSPYNTQPYIWLYKEALEGQGLVVDLEPEFNLKWLLTKGKSCQAIHLHWIDRVYIPSDVNIRPGLVRKLVNNLLLKSLQGTLRLAGFSAALFLAKLQGKIIVYTIHEFEKHHSEARPFVILRRIAHKVIFSLANQIHANNHYARNILETVYKRENGVQVIPIGNYLGRYLNDISPLEARRQLGLPEGAFVYLFLGWIRPYKGVEDLITAFEKLDLPDARLLIVGQVSKSIYQTMKNLVQDKPAIKLIPEFVPDEALQLYMNACNVCVLPYKYITSSSAVMLAWTFGRPVITPDLACFPELVTSETGVLYDPDQPDGLVLALQQAREQSWPEASILEYVRQFDWDKLGPRLATLYQIKYDGRQGQPEITTSL